jgi:branched-chain amino acid transport system substrate-binding protein
MTGGAASRGWRWARVSAWVGATALLGWAGVPIRIASIFAQSGVAAGDNALSVQGVREAVEEINAKGGPLGRRFELLEFDNLSTPIGAKFAAESAVHSQVTAIIGASWSSHTLAMAPIAQANRTPLISNISTHDEVTRVGDCVFRVCFNDSFQGVVMAKFAREVLHARTAVTITDLTSDYAIGLAREFSLNFAVAGGRITHQLNYRLRQASFTDIASEVKAAAPDVVFIPGYWESAVIIKAMRAQGATAIPLGGDGWGTERFYERGGREIVQAYFSTHWTEQMDSPLSRAFVRKYKRGSVVMDPQEALAYDAVYLLADAIRRAGTADREKVREAIAATRDFIGVTGRISFSQGRDLNRSAVIMAISNGKTQYDRNLQP